jgi:release factor glutamine methyltransferase
VTEEQERFFRVLIERRSKGEPIAYLTGHREFYGLDFSVDRRVLIPRPETELLVEAALHLLQTRLDRGERPVVADIGTGSGAIPIALAVHEPRLPYLYAVDISPDALAVAHQNCLRYHVEARIRLLQGDLLAPLPETVDLLTANLPYVGSDEMEELARDVRDYEPHLALFSGPDGLDLLRRLLQEASAKLKPGAALLLEIGYRQRAQLTHLLSEIAPHATFTFVQDYSGWDRLLRIQW